MKIGSLSVGNHQAPCRNDVYSSYVLHVLFSVESNYSVDMALRRGKIFFPGTSLEFCIRGLKLTWLWELSSFPASSWGPEKPLAHKSSEGHSVSFLWNPFSFGIKMWKKVLSAEASPDCKGIGGRSFHVAEGRWPRSHALVPDPSARLAHPAPICWPSQRPHSCSRDHNGSGKRACEAFSTLQSPGDPQPCSSIQRTVCKLTTILRQRQMYFFVI